MKDSKYRKLVNGLIEKAKQNDYRLGFAIFCIVMLVVVSPMVTRMLPIGHDWKFQLLRLESLKAGLQSGQYPVRMDPVFFNGFGYASSLFYPDFLLYIPAVLQLLGVSLVSSYKIFIILVVAVCFSATYYCTKGISKSRYVALLTAIIFTLSQYFIQNIYTRFALGEVSAYMFMPFVVYGLYNFLFEEFEKPWLLVVGFTGLLLSHMISFTIACLLCAGVSIFRIKHLIQNGYKLLRLLFVVILTAGLTCIFWLPLLEQMLSGRILITNGRTMQSMSVAIRDMIANSSIIKNESCSIGLPLLLLCLMRLILFKTPETKAEIKKIDRFFWVGAVLLFLASDLFPWKYMPSFFNFIQFPWRFYAMASLFLALAIGMMTKTLFYSKSKYVALVVILAVMSFGAITTWTNTADYEDVPADYYETIDHTYPGNGYEYLPKELDQDTIYAVTNMQRNVVADSGSIVPFEQNGVRITFRYDPASGVQYYDVPLLYYTGYGAVLVDDQGVQTPLRVEEHGSMVRVYSDGVSQQGNIVVDYSGTTLQHVSNVVSLSFCLLLIALGAITLLKKKRTIPLLSYAPREQI